MMTKDLDILIEAAREIQPSPYQEEEQRRSFAYGNTAFENPLITREMVDRQAEAIKRGRNHSARDAPRRLDEIANGILDVLRANQRRAC